MGALISQSPYLFAAFKLGLGTFVAGRMAAKESNLLLPAVVLLGGVVIWNILVGSVYMALRP
jgi:alpha-glucuronidase